MNLTEFPFWIRNLSQLEVLYVDGNHIKTVPDWIGTLTNLRVLGLGGNPLDTGAHLLVTLPSLEEIGLNLFRNSEGMSQHWLARELQEKKPQLNVRHLFSNIEAKREKSLF